MQPLVEPLRVGVVWVEKRSLRPAAHAHAQQQNTQARPNAHISTHARTRARAQVAVKAVQAAAASSAPPPPLAEAARRVLEMVVPLSAVPAVKAGLLELRAAGVLSHLTHRLAPRWAQHFI